jgi:hypothetical protein
MKKFYLLIPIIVVHLLLLIYLKFTAWPEMTLWPYLMLHGLLPYKDIAIAHTPLLLVKLSVFYKLFGVGIIQLKIFTWLSILVLDFFVFLIAKKLWNVKIALIALSSFVIWQLFFEGNGLWFDLFMGIPALVSFYFVQKKNYFWAGFFWILAFISKQTAAFFLIPIGLEMVRNTKYVVQSLKKFVFGVLPVIILYTLVLWIFRILPSFVNWAINFGIFVLPKASGQVQLPDLKALAVTVFPFLIFIPIIWKDFKKNINLLIWAIAGGLGAFPRFEYFHIQPAVPFLALATGLFFSEKLWKIKLGNIFLIFYILGSLSLFGGFFMRDWGEGIRFYEQNVQDVVAYVDSNTKLTDKIFVMNWWDSVYSLSDRLPAVDPWIPQLSWYTEIPGIQENMVADLNSTKPKLIILYPYSDSGLSAYIPQKVYNYVMQNYKLKEKVDDVDILTLK